MMSEEKREGAAGEASTPVPVVTGTLVVDAQGSGYAPPPSAAAYPQQYRFIKFYTDPRNTSTHPPRLSVVSLFRMVKALETIF